MYAVTAATGHFGRLAVTNLIDRGVAPTELVAIVRNRDKAKWIEDAGVQVRVADYDEPDALRNALAGVDRLLLVSSNSFIPGQRAVHHRNVIEAASSVGVSRIVYTSLLHADTNTMPLGQDHRITEDYLREAGVPAVVLRNGWYVENFVDQLEMYQRNGAIVGAAGDARIAPATRADLAEAAVNALLSDTIVPATYELAGPSVTLPDLASVLGQAVGKELPYRNVTMEEFKSGLLAAGLDENAAGFVTALEAGMANSDLDSDATDLERLLGRGPTDLKSGITAGI